MLYIITIVTKSGGQGGATHKPLNPKKRSRKKKRDETNRLAYDMLLFIATTSLVMLVVVGPTVSPIMF